MPGSGGGASRTGGVCRCGVLNSSEDGYWLVALAG
jgi:hypothetical protein